MSTGTIVVVVTLVVIVAVLVAYVVRKRLKAGKAVPSPAPTEEPKK